MNKELLLAIDMLEKEKGIDREKLFETIEKSLITACSGHLKKPENTEKSDRNQKTEIFKNVKVEIDRKTCEFKCYVEKTVVEEVTNPIEEITLEEARAIKASADYGDIVNIDINSKEIGRIAAQNARNVITQMIRETERKTVYNVYSDKMGEIVTGTVQRRVGKNIFVDIGMYEAVLELKEQVKIDGTGLTQEEIDKLPGDRYNSGEKYKFLVLEVNEGTKGPRILLSRTHPDLIKRLFEAEIPEVKEGIVEIVRIAREAGSRTKISVRSNDPNVDPVGACLGLCSERVNNIVRELHGEKIDVINWDENYAYYIENALSPARVINVFADPEESIAKVVVADDQLSLAIGLKGQNARLAARLTGYKIDIKDETNARNAEGFRLEDYLGDDYEEFDGYVEVDDEETYE